MSEISQHTTLAVSVPKSYMAGSSNQSVVSVAQPVAVSLPASVQAQAKESEQPLSAESAKAAAHVGNVVLQATGNRNLQFQVDESTKQVVVKIVDSKTGEVVRQIPTVEMLDFIRAMKEQESNIGKLYRGEA